MAKVSVLILVFTGAGRDLLNHIVSPLWNWRPSALCVDAEFHQSRHLRELRGKGVDDEREVAAVCPQVSFMSILTFRQSDRRLHRDSQRISDLRRHIGVHSRDKERRLLQWGLVALLQPDDSRLMLDRAATDHDNYNLLPVEGGVGVDGCDKVGWVTVTRKHTRRKKVLNANDHPHHLLLDCYSMRLVLALREQNNVAEAWHRVHRQHVPCCHEQKGCNLPSLLCVHQLFLHNNDHLCVLWSPKALVRTVQEAKTRHNFQPNPVGEFEAIRILVRAVGIAAIFRDWWRLSFQLLNR